MINSLSFLRNKPHNAFPHSTDAMLVQMEKVYLKSTFDEVLQTFNYKYVNSFTFHGFNVVIYILTSCSAR